MSGKQRGAWPGLDMNGLTLTEVRRRVRGEPERGGNPPPSKEPERLGSIIERMREKGELP